MKIFGVEAPAGFKPLTVRDLKDLIARHEAAHGIGSLDEHWVHFLRMEGTEDDVATNYATHAEVDCFDTDTGDPDDSTKAYLCLSLLHEPSRKP